VTSLQILTAITGLLTVFVGGSASQMFMAWIRRKGTNDIDSATAGATISDTYKEVIAMLREQLKEAYGEMEIVETRYQALQRQFTDKIDAANTEITRLTMIIAQMRTELAIAHRQVEDLTRR
jgi:TolA-binding protein